MKTIFIVYNNMVWLIRKSQKRVMAQAERENTQKDGRKKKPETDNK